MKHQPSKRFVAARLKLHHELRWRLAPTRKLARKWVRDGTVDEGADDQEVWVHARATEEEIDEWQRKLNGTDPEKTVHDDEEQGNESEKTVQEEEEVRSPVDVDGLLRHLSHSTDNTATET